MTLNLLTSLLNGALADAAAREAVTPAAELESQLDHVAAPLDAYEAFAHQDRISVIAEIKRASPSKGPLADIPDPAALATKYESAGATAISVLTEGRSFLGSLEDLRAVKSAVSVPVLRKDFIGNRYQVLESRVAGADIILLIVACLDDQQLRDLFEYAKSLGLAVLVETRSADEIQRAVSIGANIIGVNARDLDTFQLNTDLFAELAHQIPSGVIRVAESAVHSAADVAKYRQAGAEAVLVGEALVTGDPVALISSFLAVHA